MRRIILAVAAGLLASAMASGHAASAMQAFNGSSMAQIVSSQNGKPFVLVVWSLDCEYCKISLAALARERRKHKDLHVVTLSMDALEDKEAAALMRKKLASLGMSTDAWAFGSAPPEQLRYAIDPAWHGEMPRSYWFGAKGESIAYSGVITPSMINKLSRQSSLK